MRNRAGIYGRSPAGTEEVVFSDVTMAENGWGCGPGHGGYRPGSMRASFRGTSGIKRNFHEIQPPQGITEGVETLFPQ
jgi:hypothetical protein